MIRLASRWTTDLRLRCLPGGVSLESQESAHDRFQLATVPTTASLDLMEILQLSEDQFAQRFRPSPVAATTTGHARNAILVAGKQRLAGAIPSLIRLLGDEDELIRASAAWALGQTGGQAAGRQLAQAAETEASPLVQQSIAQALRRLGEPR